MLHQKISQHFEMVELLYWPQHWPIDQCSLEIQGYPRCSSSICSKTCASSGPAPSRPSIDINRLQWLWSCRHLPMIQKRLQSTIHHKRFFLVSWKGFPEWRTKSKAKVEKLEWPHIRHKASKMATMCIVSGLMFCAIIRSVASSKCHTLWGRIWLNLINNICLSLFKHREITSNIHTYDHW